MLYSQFMWKIKFPEFAIDNLVFYLLFIINLISVLFLEEYWPIDLALNFVLF